SHDLFLRPGGGFARRARGTSAEGRAFTLGAAFAAFTRAAVAAAITTAEAATVTAAEAAAITTAETATIAAAETAAIATFVALAHLHRRLRLVRLDLDGQKAQDIGRQTHPALHFRNGGGRRIDVEEGVMSLAALLDLVGEALEAPVLGLGDLALTSLDDFEIGR